MNALQSWYVSISKKLQVLQLQLEQTNTKSDYNKAGLSCVAGQGKKMRKAIKCV